MSCFDFYGWSTVSLPLCCFALTVNEWLIRPLVVPEKEMRLAEPPCWDAHIWRHTADRCSSRQSKTSHFLPTQSPRQHGSLFALQRWGLSIQVRCFFFFSCVCVSKEINVFFRALIEQIQMQHLKCASPWVFLCADDRWSKLQILGISTTAVIYSSFIYGVSLGKMMKISSLCAAF